MRCLRQAIAQELPTKPGGRLSRPTPPQRAKVGRDADAQVKLALWCEAHGLSAERIKHLALADRCSIPHNADGRGLAGTRLLPGQVAVSRRGHPPDPGRPGAEGLRQDYLQRRARTPDRADDQWKLALWCEENGLKEQATAHLYQVLKHEPGREAAWKRLGFKKVGGRWVKPEMLAAERAELEAQNRANKFWKPRLEHWRNELGAHDRGKRAEAEQALGQITDPRAVPMVWNVFARGDEAKQQAAVRILGQIDAPGSSRALALLGLFSPSATVRQSCTEILRRRDPREFAGLLVAMIRDPIKYKVRPVGGPGSPGGSHRRRQRGRHAKAVQPAPQPGLHPRDQRHRVSRRVRPAGRLPSAGLLFPDGRSGPDRRSCSLGPPSSTMSLRLRGRSVVAGGHEVAGKLQSTSCGESRPDSEPDRYHGSGSRHCPTELRVVMPGLNYAQIPIGQMMAAAEATAYLAQRQLAADVRSIRRSNAAIAESNGRALQMLGEVSGQNFGADRSSWEKWLTDLQGLRLCFAALTGR